MVQGLESRETPMLSEASIGRTMPTRDQSSDVFRVGQRQMVPAAELHWDAGCHGCAEAHHSAPMSPLNHASDTEQQHWEAGCHGCAEAHHSFPGSLNNSTKANVCPVPRDGNPTTSWHMKLTVKDMAQLVKALAAQVKWPKFNSCSPHKGGRREQTP